MRMHHPGKTPAADQPDRTATPAPRSQAAICRSAVGDVPGGRDQPLALPVAEGMRAHLGGDFSHVPVYTDRTARAAAARALAYTFGPHVAAGDDVAGNDTPAVQRSTGNAAVSRMLEQVRHQHSTRGGHQQAAPALVRRSIVRDVLSDPGQPLAAPLKDEMEARLGADFSQVRVHTDSVARASAAEVGARAYTVGNHVVIGDGRADKQTFAHELTHVIQQRQGPVAGTDNRNGLKVSDPLDVYERAAEANASRVMMRSTVSNLHSVFGNQVVQRMYQSDRITIKNQAELNDAVESEIEENLGGIQGLFLQQDRRDGSSLSAWAGFSLHLHGGGVL